MNHPTVSVIMATYNTPFEWLEESIRSILQQSFTDFEFIIVDDGSVNTSVEDAKRIFADDKRIRWIKNETNIGLAASLNVALNEATGKYIARMDADDISYPNRLEVQHEYMESHLDVIACGTYRFSFGLDEKIEKWNMPKSREKQQAELFFYNCGPTHPTVMMRRSMLDKNQLRYHEKYRNAEDYGLWVDCLKYAPMYIIPRVLLRYRKSTSQTTNANLDKVMSTAARVRIDQVRSIGIEPTDNEIIMHERFCQNLYNKDPDCLEKWIKNLKARNAERQIFQIKAFNASIDRRWYQYCRDQYRINLHPDYAQVYRRAKNLKQVAMEAVLTMKVGLLRIVNRICAH